MLLLFTHSLARSMSAYVWGEMAWVFYHPTIHLHLLWVWFSSWWSFSKGTSINLCTNETKPILPPNITAVLNEATTRCNTHRHICMPHKVSWSELMMYNTHMPKLSLGYMLVHCLTFNIHSSLNVFCSGEWKQNITKEQRNFYGLTTFTENVTHWANT